MHQRLRGRVAVLNNQMFSLDSFEKITWNFPIKPDEMAPSPANTSRTDLVEKRLKYQVEFCVLVHSETFLQVLQTTLGSEINIGSGINVGVRRF